MVAALMTAMLVAAPPQQFDTTFAVRAGGRMSIENQLGSITVRSWDRGEVRVRARYTGTIRIDLERSSSSVQLGSHNRRGARGPVDYEITVPQRFDIEIDGVQCSIDIAGIEGDVHAETVGGNVTLSKLDGKAHIESTSGRIVTTETRGGMHLETVNQGISVTGHTGDLSAETVNGPLNLTGIHSDAVDAETINGTVQYDGEIRDGGRYALGTHNGSLVVFVPEGTNATVTLETYNGEINADFPIRVRGGVGRGRSTFTIGTGGARLELASFGGSISLRRPQRH